MYKLCATDGINNILKIIKVSGNYTKLVKMACNLQAITKKQYTVTRL